MLYSSVPLTPLWIRLFHVFRVPPPVAKMASIRVDGYNIPLVFLVGDSGRARVPSHLLHVRFRFVESSIYVEEEQRSKSGDVVQSIPVGKSAEAGTYAWYLPPGNYRVYGLPLSMLAASTEIHNRQSHNSTVDMPCSPRALLCSPHREALRLPHTSAVLPVVKVERLDPIIELSSKSEGESSNVNGQKRSSSVRMASGQLDIVKSMSTTPSRMPCHSSLSVPPIETHVLPRPSIMDCLLRLVSMHQSRNELSTMDLSTMKHKTVPFLPLVFDGDVIFELPPCGPSSSASGAKNLEGMEKRYDGHPWCKLVTTNIHNSDNLKFRKLYYTGHLVCENANYEYLKRASKQNEIEWSGYTVIPFTASGCPPKQSTLVCMVCKMPPTCLGACTARIYFAYSNNPEMTRAAIHLGHHGHPVARGMYRDSTEVICGLIAEQVAKTSIATNSVITLSASKDFLGHYLFHNGEGEKKMLKAEEIEEVMDCFQYLSSPSICNVISSFRSNNHGGIIDNIMTMKRESKFEFIHDSIFPGQGKEKVYMFKMLTEGPGSGVDLVRRMQPPGDLHNAWLMFNRVKLVKD